LTAHPGHEFLDALRALSQALDDLRAPSMIIGGVAVIALGVPRLTVDIDATVAAADVDVARLNSVMRQRGITPRIPEAETFARTRQVFLAVHEDSGTPIDISLAWLPFEEEALRDAVICDYSGVRIRVPRPEDLVIYKLIASRPRDIEDAEGLLVLYGATIDVERIRRAVGEFARVLEDDDRLLTLQRLLAKTRPR
jgi:hypothetical protein